MMLFLFRSPNLQKGAFKMFADRFSFGESQEACLAPISFS